MVDSGNKQSNLDKFEALTKSRKASGAPVRRGGSLQMPSAATAPVKIVRSKSTGDLNQSKDGQTVDQADRLLSFEQLEQGLASLNHFSGLEDGQTRVGSLLAMPDGGDAVLESLSVALGVSEEILEEGASEPLTWLEVVESLQNDGSENALKALKEGGDLTKKSMSELQGKLDQCQVQLAELYKDTFDDSAKRINALKQEIQVLQKAMEPLESRQGVLKAANNPHGKMKGMFVAAKKAAGKPFRVASKGIKKARAVATFVKEFREGIGEVPEFKTRISAIKTYASVISMALSREGRKEMRSRSALDNAPKKQAKQAAKTFKQRAKKAPGLIKKHEAKKAKQEAQSVRKASSAPQKASSEDALFAAPKSVQGAGSSDFGQGVAPEPIYDTFGSARERAPTLTLDGASQESSSTDAHDYEDLLAGQKWEAGQNVIGEDDPEADGAEASADADAATSASAGNDASHNPFASLDTDSSSDEEDLGNDGVSISGLGNSSSEA